MIKCCVHVAYSGCCIHFNLILYSVMNKGDDTVISKAAVNGIGEIVSEMSIIPFLFDKSEDCLRRLRTLQ